MEKKFSIEELICLHLLRCHLSSEKSFMPLLVSLMNSS